MVTGRTGDNENILAPLLKTVQVENKSGEGKGVCVLLKGKKKHHKVLDKSGKI